LNICDTTVAVNTRYSGRNRWCLSLLVALCLVVVQSYARETRISNVRTLLADGVYRIGARVDFEFNETLHDALHNGVPLLIELRIEVLRQRRWFWAELVAELRQRFELQYHALSRRYLVSNYSTGVQRSFSSMNDALEYIGNVYDLPLIDANLLEHRQPYKVRMRADLDVESLPTPVRLWAYLGSAWSLKGDWYQWHLER
jgi:hypothetical protein